MPESMPRPALSEPTDPVVIDRLIRSRHTAKLMLPVDQRAAHEGNWSIDDSRALDAMLDGAAFAPFHRRADPSHRDGALPSPLPWRCHVLEGAVCTELLTWLNHQAVEQPDSKWSRAWQSKIKEMLSACGTLVQVTWLPDPPTEQDARLDSNKAEIDAPAMTLGNIEHIAAAAAATQNLLLAAEARQWKSYWSSGGILRDPDVFSYLGIGANERLLGSIFLSPSVADDTIEKAGGLREERGELGSWTRRVTFHPEHE